MYTRKNRFPTVQQRNNNNSLYSELETGRHLGGGGKEKGSTKLFGPKTLISSPLLFSLKYKDDTKKKKERRGSDKIALDRGINIYGSLSIV